MTPSRTYTKTGAMQRLLEHGPLTLREAVAITGWPGRTTEIALTNLQLAGKVRAKRVRGMKCRANAYHLINRGA